MPDKPKAAEEAGAGMPSDNTTEGQDLTTPHHHTPSIFYLLRTWVFLFFFNYFRLDIKTLLVFKQPTKKAGNKRAQGSLSSSNWRQSKGRKHNEEEVFLTGGPRISPETLEHTKTCTYAPSHTQDEHVNTHPVLTRNRANGSQRRKINHHH